MSATSERPAPVPRLQVAEGSGPRALLLLGQASTLRGQPIPERHSRPEHWALLAGHLRAAALGARCITDDLESVTPTFVRHFDVVLNFTLLLTPPAEQVAALVAAVEEGRGFIELHAATVTFLYSPAYLAMLGCRSRGHEPIKRFRVSFVDRMHPITHGVEDFEIEDELFRLTGDMSGQRRPAPLTEVHVLAAAEDQPLLYAKEHGRGRVVHIAIGLDERSLGHPTYRALFTRAIDWLTRSI